MKTVTIVGVGALGSHAVQFLRNEAALRLIDFDKVESKNILSQFQYRGTVGKAKVEALRGAMQYLWHLKVETFPRKLEGNNVDQLLAGSDLILDCMDNAEGRNVVQNYAKRTKVPCLHAALAPDGEFGRGVWTENFKADHEGFVGAPTCENGEHLPFIAVVSAYLCSAAKTYLRTGKKIGFQVNPQGSFRT